MGKIKKIELRFRCDEDWGKMTPLEKGRHCAACQKTVIDFSCSTDKQIIHFYERTENQTTCGRFRLGQLEKLNQNLETPQPPDTFRFMKPILASALLSTVACSSPTSAPEGKKEQTEQTTLEKTVDDDTSSFTLEKIVAEPNKPPVVFPREKKVKTDKPNEVELTSERVVETGIIELLTVTCNAEKIMKPQTLQKHTAGVPLIQEAPLAHEKQPLQKRIFDKIKRIFHFKKD